MYKKERNINFILYQLIETNMLAREKILDLEELREVVDEAKAANKVVALCHGCFDILHMGHLRHFESASAMADLLVVTVTQDQYINKGPNEPVFPELQSRGPCRIKSCGLGSRKQMGLCY